MFNKKYWGSTLLLCLMPTLILAQSISDVPRTDPAFFAVSRSVREGYLSLFEGDIFQGQQPVSRKELAIIIDKLLSSDLNQNNESNTNAAVTKADMQELKNFMRSYKKYVMDNETTSKLSESRLVLTEGEQKVLNTDISKLNSLNNDLKSEIASLKQEQLYLWIGVVGSAVLGSIIFK